MCLCFVWMELLKVFYYYDFDFREKKKSISKVFDILLIVSGVIGYSVLHKYRYIYKLYICIFMVLLKDNVAVVCIE